MADIGKQHEGFLFSLSNPSNNYPQFLPIRPGKTSGRTDPLLGPSFGQHDLELYQDASGRLKGFSGLGESFDITNISLSPSAARNFFTGSQQFYPDKVEVFYYHGKNFQRDSLLSQVILCMLVFFVTTCIKGI